MDIRGDGIKVLWKQIVLPQNHSGIHKQLKYLLVLLAVPFLKGGVKDYVQVFQNHNAFYLSQPAIFVEVSPDQKGKGCHSSPPFNPECRGTDQQPDRNHTSARYYHKLPSKGMASFVARYGRTVNINVPHSAPVA